jgi:hypothetical protein
MSSDRMTETLNYLTAISRDVRDLEERVGTLEGKKQ